MNMSFITGKVDATPLRSSSPLFRSGLCGNQIRGQSPLKNRKPQKTFKLPGMKTFPFAFDGNAGNPYLPHNHQTHSVVYTRAHDNDTSLSWYENLSLGERHRLRDYLGFDVEANMPCPLDTLLIFMLTAFNPAVFLTVQRCLVVHGLR